MTVGLIFDRIGHHSRRSGYDQIYSHLRNRIDVEQIQPFQRSRLSSWFWQRMINHAGVGWYDQQAASLETAVAWRMLSGKRTVFHHLYGENTYRFLGYMKAARFWGGALMASYHQPPTVFERVISYRKMLTSLDAMVLVSNSQVPYFSSMVSPRTKVAVIPHGVDTDYYAPGERHNKDTITCICVGQWLRDFDMLKSVAEYVLPRDRRVRFLAVGCGPAREKLQNTSNIEIAGRLSDDELLTAYQQADIMVFPLTDSTANNALLEGLSCGLPMVTTDVGGTRDYVDESCAFLHQAGDVKGMAETVLSLAADDQLRSEMGRRSRARSLDFDWNRVMPQLIDLYKVFA